MLYLLHTFPRRFYIYCVLLRGEKTVLAEQASTGGAPVPLTVCGGPGRPCPRSGAEGARPAAQPAAPLPSDTAPLRPGWNHRRCWSLPSEEWLRSSGDRAEYGCHRVNSLIERLKSKEQPTQRKNLSDCFESWGTEEIQQRVWEKEQKWQTETERQLPVEIVSAMSLRNFKGKTNVIFVA